MFNLSSGLVGEELEFGVPGLNFHVGVTTTGYGLLYAGPLPDRLQHHHQQNPSCRFRIQYQFEAYRGGWPQTFGGNGKYSHESSHT
jgi:hypothetical protein